MNIGGSAKVAKEKETTKEESQKARSGFRTEQLQLDDLAIQKIIGDVLGGTQGLASIFGGEQAVGIFDSSVSAQAAGDLAANLVGELAKITGVTEIREGSLEQLTSRTDRKKTAAEIKANASLF